MKTLKLLLTGAGFFFCAMLSFYSNIAAANYGAYDMSGDFTQELDQNPLDRDYKLELAITGSMKDMHQLEAKYINLWDRELNVIYQRLLARLDDERKDLLIDAQVGWLQWHTRENEYLSKTFAQFPKYGTLQPLLQARAFKSRLRERTLELMEYYYLECGEKADFDYNG